MKHVSNRQLRIKDLPRNLRLLMVIAPIAAICLVAMIKMYSEGEIRATITIAGIGVLLSLLQFAWDKWKYPDKSE